MAEPAVSVQSVHKVYEPSPFLMRMLLRSSITSPVTALDGVSLEVAPGEVCAVVGPNGAGKSTLFRILTGLTTPTLGSASVMGFDSTADAARVRRLVGFAPAEERTLLLRHTCRENLVFHGLMQGMPRSDLNERITETLETVGLAAESSKVGFALSSGMRARLQLARAMLHRPRVLILDEPTSAVDPVSAFEFVDIVQTMARDEGVAVLMSSHRLEEIETLEDKIVLLNRGRVIYAGHLQSLRKLWERPLLEIVFSSQSARNHARARIETIPDVEVAGEDNSTLRVSLGMEVGELLAKLGPELPAVESVQQARMQLLELFAKVLRGHPDGNEPGPR